MSVSNGDDHVDIGVTRARQARRGVHAFWILVISFTLGALALFLAWMFHAPGLGQVHGQARSDAPAASTFSEPPAPAAETGRARSPAP
jgi:hypothetical protein